MAKIKFTVGGVIVEKELDLEQVKDGAEIEIKSDELVVYSKGDFETFKTNLTGEEYKNGKIAGVEMAVKEAKQANGLEFEGKSMDSFVSAFKAKIESGSKTEPNAKIAELETELQTVRGSLTNVTEEFTGFKTEIAQKETRQKKDSYMLGLIPNEGVPISKDIALMALRNKAGFDVDYDEAGKPFATINGNVVKDDRMAEPVSPELLIADKLKELNLLTPPEGGNGGGDSSGQHKANSYDAFATEMEKKGVNPGSTEYNEEMNKRIANKTLEA